MFCLDVTF